MSDQPARTPSSVPRLIAETFRLYLRYPGLFLALAAGVLVPYQLIVLAATGTDPFNRAASLSFGASQLLGLIELVLVNPLVSALHVHAVADVEEGQTPRIGAVARRGLASCRSSLPLHSSLHLASSAASCSWSSRGSSSGCAGR